MNTTLAMRKADGYSVLESALAGVRQAKVSYIARDLAPWVPVDLVYATLLRRGVFKWLAVRRELIRLKNAWRDEIRILHTQLREERDPIRRAALRGRLHALEEARAAIRALCHLPRVTAPDNDPEAQLFVKWQAATPGPLIGAEVRVYAPGHHGQHGTVLEYERWGTRVERVRIGFFDADGRPYSVWLRPERMEVVRP